MRNLIPFATLAAASATGALADEDFLFQPQDCTGCDFVASAAALEGDLAAVSARTGPFGAGLVYLIDPETGQQVAKIVPDDGQTGDRFGEALDTDGEHLVVGAYYARPNGVMSGQVYVYDGAGAEVYKLLGADSDAADEFGHSVAINGRKILVGAPYGSTNNKVTGAAYLFDAQTGNELKKLTPVGGMSQAGFGMSVDLDETSGYAVVGAPWAYGGVFGIGAAYVYDVRTGKQLFELAADNPLECVNFGMSVAVDGTRALIAAPNYDEPGVGHGTVYVFDLATGQQLQQWTIEDEPWQEFFGWKIALDGDTAIVSNTSDASVGHNAGVVYAYHVPSGHLIMELRPAASQINGWFGTGVALDGDQVLISAYLALGGQGGAYGFDLGLDPIGKAYCTATNNSTGGAGQLSVVGSEDADDECVIVRAEGLPTSTVGLFLNSQSSGSLHPPGSQGELCLGGGIGRYDVNLIGDDGGMSILLDLQDTPTPGGGVAIQPGETWHFQAWYVDHNPHQTSNFTDAIEVTFH